MISIKLFDFFQNEPDITLPATFTEKSSLVRSGIIDSFSIVKLVVFLEKTFQIEMSPEDFTEENLDSIERLEKMVSRKTAKKGISGADSKPSGVKPRRRRQ